MTTKKTLDKSSTEKHSKKKPLKEELGKDKKTTNKNSADDEPSWYHYFIILGALALIIFGSYFIFELFNENEPEVYNDPEEKPTFMYEHYVGENKYNIEFSTSFEEIEELNYSIPFTELELFNTQKFYFSFKQYNGTDNGYVTYSAIKLRRFLSSVYFFKFQPDQFVEYENITCENSTKARRVMVFDIYSNQTGITTDENGCLYFHSQNPDEILKLVDSFMYKMIMEE